jgi:hypothetical protein
MELDQSLSLAAVLRAVTAAAEDDNHRILSLQLGELSVLSGVVGQLVVGEDRARDHI